MMVKHVEQGLYVARSGESNLNSGKPPVILLHGLFGMGRNLGAVARALSDQYAVFSFDLPNHGRSPHSDAMTISSMADDVLAMIDHLGLQTVNVLGHSLGGKVAMSLALRHPLRVHKLVVADIAPVTYPSQHDAVFAGLSAIDLQQAKNRAQVQQLLQASIEDASTCQFLMQNLEKQEQGFRWRMNLMAITKSYAELRHGLSLDNDHQVFENPVLFIAGELSEYIKPEYEAMTRVLFPSSRFEEIAGASHWLHAEKSEIFNALVLAFFK